MGRSRDEISAALPEPKQAQLAQRAQELIREELSLRALRKALDLTQVDVARRLKRGQEEISRIERRKDHRLSTLQSYVESLGGELELVCHFKDRPPVRLGTRAGARELEHSPAPTAHTPRLPAFISRRTETIAALCRRFAVRHLAVFGSALGADFNPKSSDLDFAVEFESVEDRSAAHQYFDFKAELEQLLGHPADLVEWNAMPDTRLRRIIERTQIRVYAKAG